jgi:hypothetical protein
MTRTKFRNRLALICIGAACLAIIAVATKQFDYHPEVYTLLRDMAGYVLLAVGPYVGYLFQRRAKFLELLQEEWRRINTVKQDIISYCEKGKNNPDDYVDLYSKLSITIDNMRVLFCNVGESTGFVGWYPYETLHDFRRELRTVDPRQRQVPSADLQRVRRSVVSSFQAFRDVFLIELGPVEPDFPIVAQKLSRLRKSGVDPQLYGRIIRKSDAVLRHFGVQGTQPPKGN